jgi:large subunit ribosomal protein L5
MAEEKKGKKGKGQEAQGGGKRRREDRVEIPEIAEAAVFGPPARLLQKYRSEVVPQLKKDLNLKSVSQVPRIEKIVINMGLGDAVANAKVLESAVEELKAVTGQKPMVTKARKSISNFKLREGMSIGAMVTLRRNRMWEFFDRLVNLTLPRVRDFRGVSEKAFDGRGNYTLGLKEQIIFPEIDYDKVERVRGMNISIVTTAENDEHGRALLAALGLPFRKKGGDANAEAPAA